MKVAEFFAGIGLVRLGLERAGWEVIYATDISASKQRMYEANFGSGEFDRRDIAEVRGEQVPDVDLATASFPCTDLSLAGERAGLNGTESGTLWEFLRVLQEMGARQPRQVMLENVTGFISSNGGRDFRAAIKGLNKLGYACDALVVDAVHFVPQSRPRVFVTGTLDAGPAVVPDLLDPPCAIRPGRLIRAIQENRDLVWKLRQYPPPPERTQEKFWRLLEDRCDLEWWPEAKVDRLLDQMSSSHRAAADEIMSRRSWTQGTVYRRVRNGTTMAELRLDGIAGCLRTPRGGSSRQIVFAGGCEKAQARFMTPREYARLQGVPDSFKIVGSTNDGLFAFGDAVCVPGIEWLAANALG